MVEEVRNKEKLVSGQPDIRQVLRDMQLVVTGKGWR